MLKVLRAKGMPWAQACRLQNASRRMESSKTHKFGLDLSIAKAKPVKANRGKGIKIEQEGGKPLATEKYSEQKQVGKPNSKQRPDGREVTGSGQPKKGPEDVGQKRESDGSTSGAIENETKSLSKKKSSESKPKSALWERKRTTCGNWTKDKAPSPQSISRKKVTAVGGLKGRLNKSLNRSNAVAANSEAIAVTEGDLTLATGRLARFANGSVVASSGGHSVLAAFVRDSGDGNADMVSLSLDYKEKAFSRGMIPMSLRRKETVGSDKEVLTSRLIDRGLRPLIMDYDRPLGAVRVGLVNRRFVTNPNIHQLRKSSLNLLFVGTEDNIVSLEAEAAEISEETFFDALCFAHKQILPIIETQKRLQNAYFNLSQIQEKVAGPDLAEREISDPQSGNFLTQCFSKYDKEVGRCIPNKGAGTASGKFMRAGIIGRLRKSIDSMVEERYPHAHELHRERLVGKIMKLAYTNFVRKFKMRVDGRTPTQLRSIRAEVGPLGGDVHGSAIFERGDTQVLASATLGLPEYGLKQEEYYMHTERVKRFMLHYDFPSYCNGELGGDKKGRRREIGHGYLAEKSLSWMVPTDEEVYDPYKIFSGNALIGKRPTDSRFRHVVRVNANVMGSDGSSSMASVCSGSMALMHAGVPMESHVAGISIGLLSSRDKNGKATDPIFLNDILGFEDHYGDMDFKVSGTRKGITAVQLDVKLEHGLPLKWAEKALSMAKTTRLEILEVMERAINKPSTNLPPSAPVIETRTIDPLMRPVVMRDAGEMLKRIHTGTGVQISMGLTGELELLAPNQDALRTAKRLVNELVGDIDVGSVYVGEVVRATDFGLFVEVLPGRMGLLHISDLLEPDVTIKADAGDYLPRVGTRLKVVVVQYDRRRGEMKLQLAEKEEGEVK